jgi:CheY-like chemotaxis protein
MRKRQKPPVLVVDDQDEICAAIRMLLEDEGYEVLWTGDGASALNILRSTDQRFVVLLDYLMPQFSGDAVLETVAAEQNLQKRHRFILLTAVARTFPAKVRRLLQTLAVPVVHKPFDIDDLSAVVHQVAQAMPVRA